MYFVMYTVYMVSPRYHILAGAILGCPTAECIHLADFTQRDVISVEGVSTDASKLALNLLDVFFTKDILSTSLATRWEGRDLLNPEVIEGIRCKCVI